MLPVPELVQLYSHAALFVCPSIYEPFGVINLEAMACQTPVVASAVGGILEVVQDGITGALVPPGDVGALTRAMTALLEDPARGLAMGRAGRGRVEERFGWDAAAARTEAIYAEARQAFSPES
jgi:starch synthase